MKKIIYTIILLGTMGLTLVSCKKFLEKEPIGKIGKEVLFEDVNGVKLALNGSYNAMQSYYKSEFGMYADVASDNMISRSSKTVVILPQYNFQGTPDDDALAVGHIWLDIYETLNNVNNLLNAVPKLRANFPKQSNELDSVSGQALVLRALCHFDLSRAYAQPYNFTADASHPGIPVLLKTPSPGQLVPRKTMKETYDQIIADLQEALPLLKKHNNLNQAIISYETALGLLSRVYLYKEDWAQSAAYADLLINGGRFGLAPAVAYRDVFTGNSGKGGTVEMLFQLNSPNLSFKGTDINAIFSDVNAVQYLASAKLMNLFDEGDMRKKTMFTRPVPGTFFTKKFADSIAVASNPLTVKVIRLSEVYLNRAEANWKLGKYTEAAEDIRKISQRAHPDQTITVTYTSPADLYKQIADERNRELCFEGHRLFDIVRRKEKLQRGGDCNSTTCSLNYPNNKFVLPIPTKELDANKAIVQNPGYN